MLACEVHPEDGDTTRCMQCTVYFSGETKHGYRFAIVDAILGSVCMHARSNQLRITVNGKALRTVCGLVHI